MIAFVEKCAPRVSALLANPLYMLFGLIFLIQTGNGMVWSMIAIYAASMGANTVTVGMLISTFGGVRLLANVPAGMASEKFGRRTLIRVGCIVTAISAFGAVATSGIPAFAACLILMGIGSSMYITSVMATVVDLGSPERRLQDMSYYQTAIVIGISIGPGLGGMAAGQWGFKAPFVFLGIVALCAFWLAPENRTKAGAAKPASHPLRSLAELIKQPESVGIGMMAFAIGFVRLSSNWILLPLIATTRHHMSVSTVGIILTTGALVNLSCLMILSRLAKWLGRTKLIAISSLVTIIGALLLAFGDAQIFVWISTCFFGAGTGLAMPTLTTYVAETASEDQRGPAMGMLRTMQDGAIILAPLATGFIADQLHLGIRGAILGSILIMLGSMFIFFRSTRITQLPA